MPNGSQTMLTNLLSGRTLYRLLPLLFILSATTPIHAQERLRLATTTSTDNSGLLSELNTPFEKRHTVHIDVIAVGTGKALRLAKNGDVDVVIVHAPAAEIDFINQGFGIERLPLMHNDFIILGPNHDPAELATANNLNQALHKLADSKHHFISRGDDSGTHKKEIALWEHTGITPHSDWIISTGQGMGAVLQITNDKLAYTLSDRGTYLAQRNKLEIIPLFEGDEQLFNPYHVIIVNPQRHPHVKIALAKKYIDFIRGTEGQAIISKFKKNGQLLFKPYATQ